jgi:hypothetical protein
LCPSCSRRAARTEFGAAERDTGVAASVVCAGQKLQDAVTALHALAPDLEIAADLSRGYLKSRSPDGWYPRMGLAVGEQPAPHKILIVVASGN